jgi:uncharacterized protein YkwD
MIIRFLLIVSIFLFEHAAFSFGQDQDEKDYYSLYTVQNFRTNKLFGEVLDLHDPDINRIQAVIFFLTNEIRVKNKLLPLVYSHKLEQTAQMHAENMVSDNFFSHIDPHRKNMETPNDRALLNHIVNPYLAENIIEGYGLQYIPNKQVYLRGKGMFSYKPGGELLKPHTYLSLGETLIRRWMNSKEHKKNILSAEAVQLGCGISFYTDAGFNDMLSCKAVQDFQWYQMIQ